MSNDSPNLVRSDPPPKRSNSTREYRRDMYEKLRADPNVWYEVVNQTGKGWSTAVKKDWSTEYANLEFTTRTIEGTNSHRVRLWIRYVGVAS